MTVILATGLSQRCTALLMSLIPPAVLVSPKLPRWMWTKPSIVFVTPAPPVPSTGFSGPGTGKPGVFKPPPPRNSSLASVPAS